RHLAITAAGLTGALAAVAGHRRIAAAGLLGWAAGTAEFAAARIAPGPRDAAEVTRMVATSAAIPPTASWHWLSGLARYRHAEPLSAPATVQAVLLDR